MRLCANLEELISKCIGLNVKGVRTKLYTGMLNPNETSPSLGPVQGSIFH
jgi:hypothetical protein